MRLSPRTVPGRAIGLAAATSLAFAPGAALAQPKPVGINAAVRNQVQIRSAGTSQLHPAVLKARVMLNDEVRTGQASQLQILLLDRSTFTVGANARLAVDRFAFDPATNSRSTGISVARGAFRFMSGRVLGHPSGPASLRTPVASIGIRGTIFEGAVGADAVALASRQPGLIAMHLRPDPQTATFVVLRGPGPGTQGDTRPGAIDVFAGGRTVTLDRPGTAVFVPGAGVPPIGPFEVTPAGFQAMQLLLRTTPDMAAAAPQAMNQNGGTGGGSGSDLGDGRGSTDARGGGGHGLFGLLLGAIPAAILALILVRGGHNHEDLPTSP